MANYQKWCTEEGIDSSKAVVLQGVDADGYSKSTAEAHLKSLGDEGKVIAQRKVGSSELEVLCTLEIIDKLPPKYSLTISEDPPIVWTVIRVTAASVSFQEALEKLLDNYGKVKEDLSNFTGEDILQKIITTTSSKQYRRLRLFSGNDPIPSGEVPYETWRQLAEQMIEEPSLSDSDKKSRIAEALLPPALSIVRKRPPTATPRDLLESLAKVYGAACDGEDLYTDFRATYQVEGERPSAYLARLEEKLDQVILYDGLEESRADRARLDQFIKGCLYDEQLVHALQLRQKKSAPPDYLTLLQQVRTEEADDRRRCSQRNKAKQVKTKSHTVSVEDNALLKKIEELQVQVKKLQAAPPQSKLEAVPPQGNFQTAPPQHNFPAAPPQHNFQAQAPPVESPRAAFQRPQPRGNRRGGRGSTLCFNCGQFGHLCRDCRNATDAALVQKRLILKHQGNGQGRPQWSGQASNQVA